MIDIKYFKTTLMKMAVRCMTTEAADEISAHCVDAMTLYSPSFSSLTLLIVSEYVLFSSSANNLTLSLVTIGWPLNSLQHSRQLAIADGR